MQIVIDISSETYEIAQKDQWKWPADDVYKAIKNGTPLPKGHGDIIDRNQIEYLKAIHDAIYGHIPWSEATKKIRYSAPTIVEADTKT